MADKINRVFIRRIQPHPCEHCGETTQRPRFCQVKCSVLANNKRNGVKPRKRAETRQCVICQSPFKWISRGRRDAGKCCSRECGFDLLRQVAAARRKPVVPKPVFNCIDCSIALSGKRTVRCEPCQRLDLKARGRASYYAGRGNVRCPDCGVAIANDGSYQHRCGSCRDQRQEQNARIGRQLRRARERDASAERFDPIEVLARDAWRCHLCGRKTPQSKRGTHDDNAPELDHIIPLAAGGEHSRLNTACACRKCNGRKGDRPLGQLRLVA